MACGPLNKTITSGGKTYKWKKSFPKLKEKSAMKYADELEKKKHKVVVKRTPTGIIDIYARKG